MKTSKALLSSLLKTTQMGQVGIRSVMDAALVPELRQALQEQLRELDSIETEAHSIASRRGWEVRELDPAVRVFSDAMTRMRLTGRNTDSRIAGMMIRGNTKGMVKGLTQLHRLDRPDESLQILSQKLLDCETAGIRMMQDFL